MDNINISVKSNISMLILDNVPSDAVFISLVFDKFSDELRRAENTPLLHLLLTTVSLQKRWAA